MAPFHHLNFLNTPHSLFAQQQKREWMSLQHQAIFRSTIAATKWEQNMALQTLKTAVVDSFIDLQMLRRLDRLDWAETYSSLKLCKTFLNKIHSIEDFEFDITFELLSHTEQLSQSFIQMNRYLQ